MNSSGKEKTLFRFLLNRSLGGDATAEEIQQMNALLATYPDLGEYYLKLMQIQSALLEVQIADDSNVSPNTLLDERFWESMAEYEKTAPEIEIYREKPQRELIQKVVYPPHEKRKMSKLSIIFLAMNAAAIFFFFLFLRFAPSNVGIEVSTLTDSLHAKWANDAGPMEKGTRLSTRSHELHLREGLAKLVFDNNVKVMIEGPAEFQILTGDQIKLNFGRVYVIVPPQAYGFQITTPDAKIIDLGTEFGVQQDMHGNTELHVISGKTSLVSGIRGSRINAYVEAGNAKRLDVGTGQVESISCNRELFVRHIDSKINLIWRGQATLDLADIIGGGNGFGTGRLNVWLDLATGREGTNVILNPGPHITRDEIARIEKRVTDNRFHPVAHLPYVDGVFSPNGAAGPVQVSSKAHLWADCPDTSGIYFEDIFNGSYIETSYSHKLILQGHAYGTKEHPVLAVHSNAGITFDLDAIRADLTGFEITRFKSLCGVSQDAGASSQRTDFYVLVNGENRFQSLGMRSDSAPAEISISLDKKDRFLTLVTTDGDMNPSFDWGFFALPRLETESDK